MEAGNPEARRKQRGLTWLGLGLSMVTAIGIVAAARLASPEAGLDPWVRGAIALSPAIPFAAMLLVFVRMSRYFDELVIRMQFEALSFAVLVSIFIAFAWGQLQKVEILPQVELSMVWPLVTFIYGLGFLISSRRYR